MSDRLAGRSKRRAPDVPYRVSAGCRLTASPELLRTQGRTAREPAIIEELRPKAAGRRLGGALKSGELFSGRYQLVEVLGRGGFGEVWRAEDRELLRPVALKILRAGTSGDAAEKRFRREAVITARLRHPGLVVVHDVGQDLGHTFIVMELLEGADLAHVLRDAPAGLPLGRVVDVARQALEAIAVAHDQAVVHRDLKPANLFLQRDGRIKVCDFGIAYSSEFTKGLTPDGQVMGTFEYLSPEQCRAEQVDARSDLYSFGCVLYALLTGEPPFTGVPQVGLLTRHLQETPRSPRSLRPGIPQELDDLVLGLLAKAPRDRHPASAEGVVKALGELVLEPGLSTAGHRLTVGPAPVPDGAIERAAPRSLARTTLRTLWGAGSLLRGRYELLEQIASRGPGGTWNARDRSLDRRVTVRLLDATTSARLDPAQFDRDAKVGARSGHPGLPVIHDTDWEGDQAFTVGEPVDADDLYGVLARSAGGLPLSEALQLSLSLAEALVAAHWDSVAHLGLTWRNVLRRPGGSIAVCDFGTTGAGRGGVGSGLFTAPEQWNSEQADARADLYALGCLLYALFTARPPFRGHGPKELAHLHLTQEPPLLRVVRPAVPAVVEALGSRLLAKEPDGRPPADEAWAILANLAHESSGRAAGGRSGRATGGRVLRFCAPVDAECGTPYRAVGVLWSRGYHTGVDFPVPSGTDVRAVAAGSVVSAGWGGSFGYQVVLRHDKAIYSQYAHLSALSVKSGQSVDVGERLGRSGSTGNTTGPHLHFEIRNGPGYGSDIDPVAFLRFQGVHLG